MTNARFQPWVLSFSFPLMLSIVRDDGTLHYPAHALVPTRSILSAKTKPALQAPRFMRNRHNSRVPLCLTFHDDDEEDQTTKYMKKKSRSTTAFELMKHMDESLNRLEKMGPDILLSFYEPHLLSFSVRPGEAKRLSITSTCFALQAILSTMDPSLYSNVHFDLGDSSPTTTTFPEKQISLNRMLKALLQADWREDDLFQVPLLLDTLLMVDSSRKFLSPRVLDEELAAKVRQLVSIVLESRPKRRRGDGQILSDYIIFLCTRAMTSLQDSTLRDMPHGWGTGRLPNKALPEGAAAQLTLALERCIETSFNELCRQIAYRSANDYANFDVMRLAYSLLTYVSASNSLATSGTTGQRALIPENDNSVSTNPSTTTLTQVQLPNSRIVETALACFFAEQNTQDGLWRKGQPIYKSFRKLGRNVGNAFVFSTDTLGSLLQLLPAEYFRPHVNKLRKTLQWIETHQTVEILVDTDDCDPETGRCFGRTLKGWSSNHLQEEGGSGSSAKAQAWSTAQTLICVSKMKKVIRALMHNDVLAEFGGVSHEARNAETFERLLDSDLGDCGGETGLCRTLKDVLEERILNPFSVPNSRNVVVGGNVLPGPGATYSCILFGAPGTAKTTICESVAQYMGWDFVVIDTSAFLADGLGNVASRIRYVFERLQALEKCVILFDEIEEFCLNRETPGLGMESRMLTTAMLTAINDLRRAKRSIFFLATNRLRAFDAAITRPGRFDMQLFVGTPNLESRVTQFHTQLAKLSIQDSTVLQKAEEVYRQFLESTWTEDAMYMNYLEGLQFASSCAELVATSGEPEGEMMLTQEAMASILRAQAAVMTIRGAVREDYVASMGLSRV